MPLSKTLTPSPLPAPDAMSLANQLFLEERGIRLIVK